MEKHKVYKYGRIALNAADYLEQGYSHLEAWDKAVKDEDGGKQLKFCPRSAFLGLYGLDDRDNAGYAIKALEHLRKLSDSEVDNITPMQLWRIVMGDKIKVHNGQMDVVLALYRKKKIK